MSIFYNAVSSNEMSMEMNGAYAGARRIPKQSTDEQNNADKEGENIIL